MERYLEMGAKRMPELAEDCRDAIQFDSLETARTAFELGPVVYRCRICGKAHTSAEDPPLTCFCRLWSDIQLEASVRGNCRIRFKAKVRDGFIKPVEFGGLDLEFMPEHSWLALNPVSVGIYVLARTCKERLTTMDNMLWLVDMLCKEDAIIDM